MSEMQTIKEGAMTQKELKTFLMEHLVPRKWYKLGREKKNRICMTSEDGGFRAFFRDGTRRVGELFYKDEESACRGMKDELRKLMESAYGLTWA